MSTADLVAYLAAEFGGAAPACSSLNGALRHLRDTLAALAGRGERPLLIVDEAHLIEESATFEALRSLLNFATDGPPDLSLLLVGGPEVLLDLPTGLASRLAASCLLGPYTAAESSTYVLGRLAAAGARKALFSQDALASLPHRRRWASPTPESPCRSGVTDRICPGSIHRRTTRCHDRSP